LDNFVTENYKQNKEANKTMRKMLTILIPVLFIAGIAFADLQSHRPKTFIHESLAGQVLKGTMAREIYKEGAAAECPKESNVSDVDLGLGPIHLGPHDGNTPAYIKSYDQGFKDKKNRIEIWDTVIKNVAAYIKYCYYEANPQEDFVVIYLEGHTSSTKK
jgi:hypothetical protein